ncbi:SRPBCC domain-containing protein [Fluviicola sp.]|uniref:SRPBCC family protein n=1 Tax=Fluviicola sp. TaxID=1917219 RepID=UPI002825BE15|nr:SRPBCC domain-containing protein [Fluviicola sp.]MDR0801745.1 SRPBCC domain-containing protein [Fluviicola sp.]
MTNTTIETVMDFDVPARDLWEAITNPSNFKKWYFHIPHFTITVGESFDFYESEARKFLHHCTVMDFEKGKKFVHTWEHPQQSKGSSVVNWLVEPIDEYHSKLTLRHEGLDTFADAGPEFAPENYQMGWDAIIKTSLRNYLYLIEKLHFSININSPQTIVWETLWGKESYTKWTSSLCEGSYYEGEIKPNGHIHFLIPNGSGMYSDIAFFKENELVIFKHIGDIIDFREQPLSEETKRWTGCFEIYRLMEINADTTELEVEIDVTDSYLEFMRKHFPESLEKLKELCETK